MTRVTVNERRVTIGVVSRPTPIRIAGGTTQRIRDGQHQPGVRVDASSPQVLVEQRNTQRVDTGGRPGLPGRDGQDAGLIERRALTPIGGHVVVRSLTAELVEQAAAVEPDHGDDTLGITTNAAAAGEDLRIQRSGSIGHAGWAWAPQEPVFLDALLGGLTQVPPDPDNGFAFSQVIGFAESPTSIIIDIQPPIYF